MERFMIVSKADKLDEYMRISEEYNVSFEINDFYEPEILDDNKRQEAVIETYLKRGVPGGSTMHGVFCDIAVFSRDKKIREVSEWRMQQSMQIAKALGVKGVVFHTNYNPSLSDEGYVRYFVNSTSEFLSQLLEAYPDIQLYVENMFETKPYILEQISLRLDKYSNYGICLDWAHANIFGSGIEEWIQSIAAYVKHIHINDNDLMNDLHLPVGSGKIKWNQFFEYYNQYWEHCSILVETEEPCGQRDSLEYIRKHFGML